MKMMTLMLAGLALGAPATAHAAGICDQITGIYVDGRAGTFQGVRGALAFDRLILTAGIGNGDQVTTTSQSPTANHVQLKVTACAPLTANTARLSVDSAVPGSAFSSAGSVMATVVDGGSRVWIRGETPGAEFPGWLLRVPPAM